MKIIKSLLLAFVAASLFFTACEKEEKSGSFDTISGQLFAGENVTADDLAGLSLFLCQFKNEGDISDSGRDTSTFNVIDMAVLDELGKFEFKNISPGNYFIGLNEFIFTTDTVYRFSYDGTIAINIDKTIDRIPPGNPTPPYPPCAPIPVYIDLENYSGPELTLIRIIGHYAFTSDSATDDISFNVVDGGIEIIFAVVTPYCVSSDYVVPIHFVFGFDDGNGGTINSEEFEVKFYDYQGSCVGLPQTIGQTTISFNPATSDDAATYVITNN